MQINNAKNIKKYKTILCVIFCLCALAVFLGLLRENRRENYKFAECMGDLHSVHWMVAMGAFENDPEKGRVIIDENWPDTYSFHRDGRYCSNLKLDWQQYPNISGIGLNKNLDKMNFSDIEKLGDIVFAAETNNENNLISSPKDVAVRHFKYYGLLKKRGTIVTYCDGKTEFVKEENILKLNFKILGTK